jgi:5'-deoxynucleotidase YfbR-like HD superfamily hydrolase
MELFNYDGCINTFSGLKFSFAEPKVEQIDIFDISRGLAYRGHFGGQTEQFFSIAQHTLLVIDLMPPRFRNKPEMGLAALLHDASEAYTGDMVKPLKLMLPEFKVIEDRITEVIFEKFRIDTKLLKTVKPYDKKAQEVEYDTFFKNTNHLNYLKPEEAQTAFMQRYWHYVNLMEEKNNCGKVAENSIGERM